MSVMHNIVVGEDGRRSITVFGERLLAVADQDHPNFKAIVGVCTQAALEGTPVDEAALIDMFDIGATISREFAHLSERVTVEGDRILFDGDPCQPGLSDQILRFLDAGENFAPLVAFLENVQANPQPESRDQAWDWFNGHNFTVTEDGKVVIYKGVYSDGNGGYKSGNAGNARVQHADGTTEAFEMTYIPYAVGDTVTMPRSEVDHNPQSACSTGLHVGTYNYAKGYAGGALLQCIVDPRDVVSVPSHSSGQKIRVCRFFIEKIIEAEVDTALYRPEPVEETLDDDVEWEFELGDFVQDDAGDEGTIVSREVDENGDQRFGVEFDDETYGLVEGFPIEELEYV